VYKIILTDEQIEHAREIARLKENYINNKYSYHTVEDNFQKMFEGKLGEEAVKSFFNEKSVKYELDTTPIEKADRFDFMILQKDKWLTIDVKTRNQDYGENNMLLAIKSVVDSKPKDLYMSVYLKTEQELYIVGYCSWRKFIEVNRVKEYKKGLPSYALYENELILINENK
jgi:hypothetical protein